MMTKRADFQRSPVIKIRTSLSTTATRRRLGTSESLRGIESIRISISIAGRKMTTPPQENTMTQELTNAELIAADAPPQQMHPVHEDLAVTVGSVAIQADRLGCTDDAERIMKQSQSGTPQAVPERDPMQASRGLGGRACPGVVWNFAPMAGTGAGRRAQDRTELEFLAMKSNSQDNPPLDRWRADEVLEPGRNLWGLPQIARAAGVSIDTVRRWHRRTDAPITKPGGRYFSTREALQRWLAAR